MSKNTIKDGDSIEFVATKVKASGMGETIGVIVVVHQRAVAIGDTAVGSRKGVHLLPILSTDTPAIGVKLYWDEANSRLTTTAGALILAGWAYTAKLTGITTIECLLCGGMQ